MKKLTLSEYYYGSLSLLIAIAFALLLAAGALPLSIGLIGGLSCYWVIGPRFLRDYRVPRASPIYLMLILVICWVRAGFAMIHDDKPVQLICGVFSGLLPIFLYRKQRAFGSWMGFLVLSLLAVISVVFTNALSEYVLFMGYLVILLIHLNAANLIETSGSNSAQFMELPKGHVKNFIPSLGWGLVVASLVFFLFPRKPAIRNPFGIRGYGEQSGYTGSVSLKSESQLQAAQALAMMVESPEVEWLEKVGPKLYFRGNTLDRFEGKIWSVSSEGTQTYRMGMDLRHTSQYRMQPHRLRIYREPHETRGIIFPGVLLDVKVPLDLIGGLSVDAMGNLTRGHSDVIRYSYEVLVADPVPPPHLDRLTIKQVKEIFSSQSSERIRAPHVEVLAPYLQSPISLEGDNFLTRWVKEVGVKEDSMTVPEAIEKMRKHFYQSFQTSLNYKLSSEDGLEAFLSKDRMGHCEYFASAAALFLRALGIPTRLALGYRGGRFNKVSKTLEIYEHGAHAWVEYFFPGGGWVTFDPTPVSPLEDPPAWKQNLFQYIGAAKYWANRYLVDYNTATQQQLVKTLAASRTYGLASWKTPQFVKPSRGFFLFLLSLIMVVGRIVWRLTRVPEGSVPKLPGVYRDFLNSLEKKGIRRGRGETFRDFHCRIISLGISEGLVRQMDSYLEQSLYSSSPSLPQDVLANLKRGLGQL